MLKDIHRLLAIATAAAAMATPALPDDGSTTSGTDLLNFCSQDPSSPMHGACAGYVIAISEMTPRCDDQADGPRFRVPDAGLTRKDLIAAVTTHLGGLPEDQIGKAAHVLVMDALQATYPCD